MDKLRLKLFHRWISLHIDSSNYLADILFLNIIFRGIISDIIAGTDGHPQAVYGIQYSGDEEVTEVDAEHLLDDLSTGSLKFLWRGK
jgi:hypothetical protein